MYLLIVDGVLYNEEKITVRMEVPLITLKQYFSNIKTSYSRSVCGQRISGSLAHIYCSQL